MTRFEREIKGLLGDFWKKDAEKKVANVQREFENGEITVDENGVARNRIGRILMDDVAELLEYANCCEWFSREATRIAYEKDASIFIKAYKERQNKISDEQKYEMRAAFGEGTTIVDVLSGNKIKI